MAQPKYAANPGLPRFSLEKLSPREAEVASLVACGLTNRVIADDLHLSVKTVERHMENIFGKLDIRSRAALAAAVAFNHPARATPGD